MKKIINVILSGIIVFCLVYPQFASSISHDPDKATVQGIFDGVGDTIKDAPESYITLIDVYNTITESTNMTLGHPIHEVDGLDNLGSNLGKDIEKIVEDASVELTSNQKNELSKLFKKTSKGIK